MMEGVLGGHAACLILTSAASTIPELPRSSPRAGTLTSACGFQALGWGCVPMGAWCVLGHAG